MTDIVERLQKSTMASMQYAQYHGFADITADAADEITRLRSRVEKLEHRLEIDRIWKSEDDHTAAIEVIVPPEERDDMVDGIEARDAHIGLQNDRMKELTARVAELEKFLNHFRSVIVPLSDDALGIVVGPSGAPAYPLKDELLHSLNQLVPPPPQTKE